MTSFMHATMQTASIGLARPGDQNTRPGSEQIPSSDWQEFHPPMPFVT